MFSITFFKKSKNKEMFWHKKMTWKSKLCYFWPSNHRKLNPRNIFIVPFIELLPCLFTTKLCYAQLFKWGHSRVEWRKVVWPHIVFGPFYKWSGVLKPVPHLTFKLQSRCKIETHFCAHWYKILLVFEVPYRSRVKGMPRKKGKTTKSW